MAQDRLTEQDLLDILEVVEKRPYFKWLMARKVMNMSIKEVTELEVKFGSLLNMPKSKIEGNTVTIGPPYELICKSLEFPWQKEGLSPLELMSKHLDEVDFSVKPKVDDTQEFHLVRCPKCELMVEELVATPYRHVCASCAKGE